MGRYDALGNNGTETSPLHPDIGLDSPTNVDNLHPNVFTLSITIRPNHQGSYSPCLGHQVILHCFQIILHCDFRLSIEQVGRVATLP